MVEAYRKHRAGGAQNSACLCRLRALSWRGFTDGLPAC